MIKKFEVILVIFLILLIPVGIIAAENINDTHTEAVSENSFANPEAASETQDSQDTSESTNQDNSTIETSNEIVNDTESQENMDLTVENTTQTNSTDTSSETNISQQETETGIGIETQVLETNQTQNKESAKLDVQLILPEKITRSENVEIRTIITNNGNKEAINVSFKWELVPEFEIISQTQESVNILPDNSYESILIVKTPIYAQLGKNQIKILVNYE